MAITNPTNPNYTKTFTTTTTSRTTTPDDSAKRQTRTAINIVIVLAVVVAALLLYSSVDRTPSSDVPDQTSVMSTAPEAGAPASTNNTAPTDAGQTDNSVAPATTPAE